MYPHRMRLLGPWECQPQDCPPCTVRIPCRLSDAGLEDVAGPVRFQRRFGRPRRIDDYERVWLTFANVCGAVAIRLNDQLLGEGLSGDFSFDVTANLGDRNRLEVTLEVATPNDGLCGEVALEVRCTAYLTGVEAQELPGERLTIQGKVAGFADGPLELYVLVNGRQEHYQTIRAGDGFSAQVPAGQKVRVELVNVSQMWYSQEL
ncbi:MAG: hypothetical protein L0Y72_29245 [Gemmataceae bacterium]|nr:hypothetical protein [Gemmataceae bacterium]MCI0743134.1 hypothetical protein [Gemmataceae bacterium]